MIFCLFSLSGDETTDSRTKDWTNLMDRGGLWHVNDMVYDFFYTLETELQEQLAKTEKIETCLNGVTEKMIVNEDVLFRWWLNSVDFDDAISGRLIKRIINLYITIRGFSFAANFIAKYKKDTQKNLQMSNHLEQKYS